MLRRACRLSLESATTKKRARTSVNHQGSEQRTYLPEPCSVEITRSSVNLAYSMSVCLPLCIVSFAVSSILSQVRFGVVNFSCIFAFHEFLPAEHIAVTRHRLATCRVTDWKLHSALPVSAARDVMTIGAP